jgi:hypothetical protein
MVQGLLSAAKSDGSLGYMFAAPGAAPGELIPRLPMYSILGKGPIFLWVFDRAAVCYEFLDVSGA